jgi:hypothetical protein
MGISLVAIQRLMVQRVAALASFSGTNELNNEKLELLSELSIDLDANL